MSFTLNGELHAAEALCPACGGHALEAIYDCKNVPVHSVLLMPTREEAVNYPRGTIRLMLCSDCGFVFNGAFDPAAMEYSQRYEETQSFSGTFRTFHLKLAQTIDKRHHLLGKTVIEIGCGKGEFLTLLCETTGARGIGIDPAYVDERNTSSIKDELEFIKDLYSEKYAHYSGDLICCKMTLEHIHDVGRFIRVVASSLKHFPHAVVFFQVPNADRVFGDLAFWDIYYEHCSYFSPGSLARLFRACGLAPDRIELDYDDQYLMIEARLPTTQDVLPLPQEQDLTSISYVHAFRDRIESRLSDWWDFVRAAIGRGERIVLWGGGSKAVAFITTLGIEKEIELVVDINPHKQGTYLAGGGQEIVSPARLVDYRPDTVIVMNSVYTSEIARSLAELGLSPRLLSCDSIAASDYALTAVKSTRS